MYHKLLYHPAYIYSIIQKVLIFRQMLFEANRYQLASSEAVPSDVTATILPPVSLRTLPSGKQKLHDVFGWAVFHTMVRTQLELTEVFHDALQPLQSYNQAVPHTMPGHPFQFDLC